jgi:anti-anti-sigma regulatory factor
MSSDAVLEFKDDCTIKTALDLHQMLRAPLANGCPVTIDCSGVEQADVSFIQLLISGQKTFRSRGLDFRIGDASDALNAAPARSGLHIDPATGQIS